MNAADTIELRYRLQRGEFDLDVDCALPMRGITGLFGASGAGKTTLLRCLAGLERGIDSRLSVAGEVWDDRATGVSRPVHERAIGYVFQEPRLFRHLDVRDNLDYARRRSASTRDAPRLDEVVELLGLGPLLQRDPDALSGGEAQRVAIARALLRAPRFVLMDEPLAALDQVRKEEILPFLDRLHAELEIPIIYVSHNVEEVCRLCDHLVVMDKGRVVAHGPLQDVLVRLDVPILSGDEAGSVIPATIAEHDHDDDLTRLEFSGGALWVPGHPVAGKGPVRLRIRASDVSLCRERPVGSTILNILPAVIEALQAGRGPSVLVRLTLGEDRLLAKITRRSVRELGLKEGDQVMAQIKSVAVRHA